LKLIAVTISYASGNAGGIFGPALFIGAMLGGSVGTIAHHFFPAYTATPGAYALVGMGTVFAGIVRAPMTSVLMIFEMTRDYPVIVPLMISNMISLFICSLIQHEPTYEALAIQDGIHLPAGGSRARLGTRRVARVMKPPEKLLSAELTVREATERLRLSKFRSFLVTDKRGVIGVISSDVLEQEMAEDPERTLEKIIDVLEFPHVHADQGLDQALERMGANHLDMLPVVNRGDVHKLEGMVTLSDVLEAYGVGAESD